MAHSSQRIAAFAGAAWVRRTLFAAGGALAGFAYYYFIGCASGTCPITGNPYISTAYGAVMGLLITSNRKKSSSPG